MPFITALSRDPRLLAHAGAGLRPSSVAGTRSWERLVWLVRERPVTHVVLDSDALPPGWAVDMLVSELTSRFPSVGTVFVARPGLSPVTLLQLGRAGIAGLTLLPFDDPSAELGRSLALASGETTRTRVLRVVGPWVGADERRVLELALDGALLGWSADQLSWRAGWTRAHLSQRLRRRGLPSVGRILRWVRILHAAAWLPESGRTAESVSRQLGYANGSTFRRALHGCLCATPSEVIQSGGLPAALPLFLDVCGLAGRLGGDRSVARRPVLHETPDARER